MQKKAKKQSEQPDLSGTQLKRWVINLSKYKLSESENSVLAKGLNFAVTPTKVPVKDIIVATEVVSKKLDNTSATHLKADIAGAKIPKSNLIKDKTLAIKRLK